MASEFLGINHKEFVDNGVFDPSIDGDSSFFINIQRLKQTTVPQFRNSYKKIRQYFISIANLLDAAKSDSLSDKFFRKAFKLFKPDEVNGINLGFSNSIFGSGMGPYFRKMVLIDAFSMIKEGNKNPEIFELVGLFEEGIGPDRISDMIASIIKDDIEEYTKSVMEKLNISNERFKQYRFDQKGILLNPKKRYCQLLFVPTDILFDLPVARCWEDISTVAFQNQVIREEMNEEVREAWKNWNTKKKAEFIQDLLKNPETAEKMINTYRKETLDSINVYDNTEYFLAVFLPQIQKLVDCTDIETVDSKQGAIEAIKLFKVWVENNRGWNVIQQAGSQSREKTVQCLLHGVTKYLFESKNLDFSAEPNEGKGPVDFKISRGNDKTVIELKLSSNDKYLRGYREQIRQYAKAEGTNNMIYVYVDLGDYPKRTERLIRTNEAEKMEKNVLPELIVIKSMAQKSASLE